METMGAEDEAFAFEEIGGVRYALWTAESEPFGTRQAYNWGEFAVFLGGICVFGVFQWFLIVLAAVGAMAVGTALVGLLAVMATLLTAFVRWAFQKKRGLFVPLHEEWVARNPQAKGVPCSLRISTWTTVYLTWGLASVEGPWLVFHGTRCDARFLACDAASRRRRGVLRFVYKSPLGKKTAALVFGGPSIDGWVTKSKAAKALAPDLETWRDTQHAGRSIFPPLRSPQVRFAPGYLTVTVPLMFLAYCTVFMAVQSPWIWLVRDRSDTATADFIGTFVASLATIYAMYLVVIVGGYGVRRLMWGRNRKIDVLAATGPAA